MSPTPLDPQLAAQRCACGHSAREHARHDAPDVFYQCTARVVRPGKPARRCRCDAFDLAPVQSETP